MYHTAYVIYYIFGCLWPIAYCLLPIACTVAHSPGHCTVSVHVVLYEFYIIYHVMMQAVSIDVTAMHVHMAPWTIVPITYCLFDAALGVL